MRFLRFLVPTIVFSVIFSLSLFAFLQLRKQERQTRASYLSLQCIRKKNVTRKEVEGGTTVLSAMHDIATVYGFSQWERSAEMIMNGTPWQIVGVALLQELSGPELLSIAQRRNFTPTQRNPDGTTSALTYTRDRYLVIIEDVPDRPRIGYDYYSDPQRKALVQLARQRRAVTVSNPTVAIMGSAVTVVFFIPLFDSTGRDFIGGVSAGYRATNLLPSSFSDDVYLSLSLNGQPIYEDHEYNSTSLRTEESVLFADKSIRYRCGTNVTYVSASLIILCTGAVASVGLAIVSVYIMHLISARQRSVLTRFKIEEDKRLANVERSVAQGASKAKSDFVANISHELRTPLQGLLWMTSFLLATPLTSEQIDYALTVQASGESLLQIVNDVLDFSKIEAGKLTVELIPVDIKDLLNQLSMLYKAQAVSKSNCLTVRDTLSLEQSRVRTDPTRLRQVLNNLIGNAMKFTREDQITLSCSFIRQEAKDYLLFECIDKGIGMDSHQMKRLFQPYMQGDTSTTRRYGGTGLGLTISKQLVEALGGTIGCTSVLGEGSTFFFTIPYQPTDQVPVVTHSVDTITFPGVHVIVADDNVINRKVAGKLLAELGMVVHMAEDGVQVLKLLDSEASNSIAIAYGCILMDGFMPEMDGYEATRILRSKGYTIPIIAVTANAMEGERERCLQLGMNEFITKPIIRSRLIAALMHVLSPRAA